MIHELPVFPQVTISEHQGLVGVRKFTLDHDDDRESFLRIICSSHWPGYPDSIPIQIHSGPFWEDTVIHRDDSSPRTYETLGDLPSYGKYLIVATYALHRMTNCWPDHLGTKPWHPGGTTLNVRIRGSGQALTVSPAGVRPAPVSPFIGCTPGAVALSQSVMTRIMVPVTEYHISCDRMSKGMVDYAMRFPAWDNYEGSVNKDTFLNGPAGTVLWDGYEMTETNVCDVSEPRRWCLTACFKKRIITAPNGKVLRDPEGYAIGWNHDYIAVAGDKRWDWKPIKFMHRGQCIFRYPELNFNEMFGEAGSQSCDAAEGSETILGDCVLCGTPSLFESGSGSASPESSVSSISWPDSSFPSSSSSSSSLLPPCCVEGE